MYIHLDPDGWRTCIHTYIWPPPHLAPGAVLGKPTTISAVAWGFGMKWITYLMNLIFGEMKSMDLLMKSIFGEIR